MPELPEVETVRGDLERELLGRRVTAVAATGARTFRRPPGAAAFEERTSGRTLVEVARRGKHLLLRLDDAAVVVVHLRMSGQLLLARPGSPAARHTHATFTFDDARQLRFVDPRTFGEVFASVATPAADGWTVPELLHLGVDALDPALDAAALGRLLAARRTGMKALLLDQRALAGIGNIYADEILWAAGIRPTTRSDRLGPVRVGRLHTGIVEVLRQAIAHRGSTLGDEQYRDLYGRVGSYQTLHRVHGREARPCPRCEGSIRRAVTGGRSTFFCPRCQR